MIYVDKFRNINLVSILRRRYYNHFYKLGLSKIKTELQKKKTKNVLAGMGEIGKSIHQLLSEGTLTVGYDIRPKLMNKTKFQRYSNLPTEMLHICIPVNSMFKDKVLELTNKFSPSCVVIHSTIPPYTTQEIQNDLRIPVIYSPTRGVHKRMLYDLKRYTKFFSIERNAPKRKWAITTFSKLMKKCGVKTKKMSSLLTLELAKILVDTSYYGWLINYAQLTNMIAIDHKINYDEMWSFADEIHKYLGNRPKMFPGFIGGHCVIQNLKLIDKEDLRQIDKINNLYAKKVKNAKSIAKKYVKGRQSYDKV